MITLLYNNLHLCIIPIDKRDRLINSPFCIKLSFPEHYRD